MRGIRGWPSAEEALKGLLLGAPAAPAYHPPAFRFAFRSCAAVLLSARSPCRPVAMTTELSVPALHLPLPAGSRRQTTERPNNKSIISGVFLRALTCAFPSLRGFAGNLSPGATLPFPFLPRTRREVAPMHSSLTGTRLLGDARGGHEGTVITRDAVPVQYLRLKLVSDV